MSSGHLHRILKDKRAVVLLLAFSLLFALSWTLPSYTDGASLRSCLGEAVLLAVPLFFLFVALVWVVEVIHEAQTPEGSVSAEQEQRAHTEESRIIGQHPFVAFLRRHTVFLFVFALTFFVWLVVYLICFPGIFSADSADIIHMVTGEPFESGSFRYSGLNDHHPLLYAFLNWLILSVGNLCGLSLELAVGLLSFFHMVCLALSCAYCASTLYALTGSRWTIILCVLVLSLNPLVALYAVTVWKDILFGALALALLCATARLLRFSDRCQARWYRIIPWSLLLATCMLMRSNGLVIALVLAIGVIALVWRSSLRQVAMVAFVCALAVFAMVKGPVSWALEVESAHFAEGVSLPLQQIARTVAEDGDLSQEQEDLLQAIVPFDAMKETYDPWSANGVKFNDAFDDAFLELHKGEFLRTWLEVGLQNPGAYLRAWCDLTNCYWSVNGFTWYLSGIGYDSNGDGEKESMNLIPWLASPSNLIYYCDMYISLFQPLFKPGCLAWFMLFAAVAFELQRRRIGLVVTLALVAYWATYLVAAPAADFRYSFPLLLSVPLVLSLLLIPFSTPSSEDTERV